MTFSESEDILHFVIHPSGRIFLLIYNNRMLSAKLGCIGQAVSGKLRVTLTQQYLRWDGVFWVLRLTFSMEICQAPIKHQSWTKNHLLIMNQLSFLFTCHNCQIGQRKYRMSKRANLTSNFRELLQNLRALNQKSIWLGLFYLYPGMSHFMCYF